MSAPLSALLVQFLFLVKTIISWLNCITLCKLILTNQTVQVRNRGCSLRLEDYWKVSGSFSDHQPMLNASLTRLPCHSLHQPVPYSGTVYLFTGRTPRSCVSRYLNVLTGRKSAFSPRRGDSLHRFMWNLAQPGARDSAWPYKISVLLVGTRPPQMAKNSTFW